MHSKPPIQDLPPALATEDQSPFVELAGVLSNGKIAVRYNHVSAITPRENGSSIYVRGFDHPVLIKESYDEVKRLLTEAANRYR